MSTSKRFIVLAMLTLIGYGCDHSFPGFSEKEHGVYMKLLAFDEGEEAFHPNRYVSANIRILEGDRLVYRQFKEEVQAPKHQLAFLYHYLSEGDSAEFRIDRTAIIQAVPQLENTLKDADYLTAYVKIEAYQTDQGKPMDPEMLEQVILNKYIKENKGYKEQSGWYKKSLRKGKGSKVERDREITIHYKGSFLNNLEFDNTYSGSGLTFNYGTPGQVIPGLEKALKGMREGEKAKIIIPSQLAFGEEGSSTQVVPPYTSLVYELEIVKIN
ncbi:MAG: FKBP-type peptidyl-prolyl cis-trans isomerase [Flavobacteriales bacterium]|nr:FKBP-type peptidyl-prolyl cis-trans isomerase [Flavobacteriales bacterium]